MTHVYLYLYNAECCTFSAFAVVCYACMDCVEHWTLSFQCKANLQHAINFSALCKVEGQGISKCQMATCSWGVVRAAVGLGYSLVSV